MPTSSKNPRVKRNHDLKHRFKDSELRHETLDSLLADFENRCGYSMLHVEDASRHNMEVDHFDPTIGGAARNDYFNLIPAYSQCNNAKRRTWPPRKDTRQRYLNPTKESDYGVHIFEDAATGELLPISEEGVYQIENCALNSKFLRMKRRERTEDVEIIAQQKRISALHGDPHRLIEAAQPIIDRLRNRHIPIIPPPPPGIRIL